MKLAPVLTVLLAPSVAGADTWLVAETPAAVAISDAQAGVFRPGVMPAVGGYTDNGWFALGLRLRAGVLRDGAAPGDHMRDPGLGGLTTGSIAARVLAGGAWIEGAVGGGITGDDLVPAAELGMGWAFDVGGLELGPSIRYARVSAPDDMSTLGSASLLLAGIDLRFGRDHAKRPPRRITREAPIAAPAAPPAPRIAIEPDHDRIVERERSCAHSDDCALYALATDFADALTIVDDRIVLDERVLFDFERARVKTAGRAIVRAIAKLWSEQPTWLSLEIEGHTDVRGSDDYNLWLSQLRAERVRDALVAAGADPARITATGLGRARPRDSGTTEDSHQRNRRVEFVIHRRTEEPR